MTPIGTSFRAGFPAQAGPTIVDDFEKGDLSNYSGDTANASVTTTNPFEGTYHFRTTGGDLVKAAGTLSNYPQRGDYYIFDVAASDVGGDRIRLYWGQDIPDGGDFAGDHYYLYFNLAGPFLRLYVVDSGSRTELADVSFDGSPLANDEYFEVHVDFGFSTTNDIEIIVFDGSGNQMFTVGPVTDTTSIDNSWDIDTVAWRGYSLSSHVDVDFARINNNDQTPGTS